MEAQTVFLTLSLTFLELFNLVDAKFCAFELNGERRYYTCPRNEYCCNFGCCVSPAFQFYQLWYYWLLVIFMFLLCSGGGWWYRYWLQSRYRTCPGSILPVTNSNTRHRVPTRAASTQQRRPRPRVARVSYNPSRDAVVLHRIWKGPRNCPPPSYNSAQAELSTEASNHSSPYHSSLSRPPESSSATTSLFPPGQLPHTSTGISGQECPYYQLYGPPPSYESVMSQLGESYVPILSTDEQPTNSVSPTFQETSAGEPTVNSSLNSNVQTSHLSETEAAESAHYDGVSPRERTSVELSITNNTVRGAQSTNVQNQDTSTDSSKQTARESPCI